MMVEGITPSELKARKDAGEEIELIDVRELWEHEYARIDGSQLKPLGDLDNWAPSLDPDKHYVLYCHSGIRSYHACMILERMGFRTVKNLSGGIDAWSLEVDPDIPRY